MDLVATLKAEYEQAVEYYLSAWKLFDRTYLYKQTKINMAECGSQCHAIAFAGELVDKTRAKYEAAVKLQAQIAALTEIIKVPAKVAPALTSKQVDDNTAALVAQFAGQTVTRDVLSQHFGREEPVTRRALFEAWSSGKALYDGTAFKFMGVTA